MSYDIYLKDRAGNVLELPKGTEQPRGGTYAIGGTGEAWLNVTYNYGGIFRDLFGPAGIRSIYGMTGAESLKLLDKAVMALKDDVSDDYWEATQGNAKRAILGLRALASALPDGIWAGD